MSQQSPNRNELDAAKAQAHPAAEGELSDADLQAVAGGLGSGGSGADQVPTEQFSLRKGVDKSSPVIAKRT